VTDAVDLAKFRMAAAFDDKHQAPQLEGQVYIRMARKPGSPGYRLPNTTKLSPILQGPFRILERVSDLAYRLELPAHWKIHPVISVIHLEQAHVDDYNRRVPTPPPVLVGGQEEHEVERIVRQETGRFLVKWRHRDEETWEPIKNLREDVPEMVKAFQKRTRQQRVAQQRV
jgi:hypothetical protein